MRVCATYGALTLRSQRVVVLFILRVALCRCQGSSSSSSSIIHALQRILPSRSTSLSCTARTAEQERRARRTFPCKSVRIRPLLAAAFHAIRMHSLPISMYGGEYWLGIIYTIVMASFNPLFALSRARPVERALTQLSLLGARECDGRCVRRTLLLCSLFLRLSLLAALFVLPLSVALFLF